MKDSPNRFPGSAWLVAVALSALAACADDGGNQDHVDSGSLAVVIGDGSELASVDWTISGGALTQSLSGTIDTSGDVISAHIDSIPVGTGYTIELVGTTTSGLTCAGSAGFDIPTAGAVAMASVVLNCGGGQGDGSVVVDGEVNNCPTVAVTVSPLSAEVGETINLSASATDSDGDAVTYSWSASAGTVAQPDAASTTYECTAAGTATVELVVDDGFGCDVTRAVDVTCTDAAGAFTSYQAGHADLAFEFDPLTGEFEVILEAEGATIDGVAGVDGVFDISTVQISTDARFTRPTGDGGAFDQLCVAEGDELFWLPQGNADASMADVPFMGIAAEVDPGLFVGDVLDFQLISVDGPGGSGSYSMWKDGFPPDFRLSSCDGIDAADATQLPIGHDHFNMGFAGAPGLWTVRYRVSGELVSGDPSPSVEFDVTYDIQN